MSNFSALKPAGGSVDGTAINPSSVTVGDVGTRGDVTAPSTAAIGMRVTVYSGWEIWNSQYNYQMGVWDGSSLQLGVNFQTSAVGANGNGLVVKSGCLIGFTSAGDNLAGGPDTAFARDAAGVMAQRNGANSQKFRLYNTYTSSTNYERGVFQHVGGAFVIGTEKGSAGGGALPLALATDEVTRAIIGETGGFELLTWFKCDVATVATLPMGISAFCEYGVTDALAPSVGSVVAGGGSALAKVIYNGTNWIVTVVL